MWLGGELVLRSDSGVLVFDAHRDRPDETEQLATDGSDNLSARFASSAKRDVATVKAMLCFPRNFVDGGAESSLSLP